MEEIKHTYTIQWVGPLSYEDYKDYLTYIFHTHYKGNVFGICQSQL